jgi:hypothetical protein
MVLLTDGTVLAHVAGCISSWLQLTPNAAGSYVAGIWTSRASMSINRLYFASHVIPSGKVWVLGGEYSGSTCNQNITGTGEIYDPVANNWSPIAPHPESLFGDDPTMLVAPGKILAGSIFTRSTYLYDIATNTWGPAIPKVYQDRSDEETWVMLPGNRVLTYDLFQSIATNGAYAEVFNTATSSWSSVSPSDGTALGTIPQLSSTALGFEMGPSLRLHDGRVFLVGATQHTALYTPATNTWNAGPDTPGNFGADDAPGAITPAGHVIYAADAGPVSGLFSAPVGFFDFNPLTNTTAPVSPSFPGPTNLPSFIHRMLVLPTGQILVSNSSQIVYVYTPDGLPDPAVRPVINAVTYNGSGVFTLTGKQLNGQSSGASYGDDAESDENYPIIRLRDSTGKVFYAKTTNWTVTGVDGSAPESVTFTLKTGMTPGNYSLVDVGAGVASFSVFINITADETAGL